MCYSAQLVQDHREYLRAFPKARINVAEFAKLFSKRAMGERVVLNKGMEHAFLTSDQTEDLEIAELVRRYNQDRLRDVETEIENQTIRIEKATASLEKKETKKAREDIRIATTKISKLKVKLDDLIRNELKPRDSRVFPFGYAPVLVLLDGELTILPMRYLLRPAGRASDFDDTNGGCYNARRDNLQYFWRKQFGRTHGIVMMERFYENVDQHDYENRPLRSGESPTNVIVEFRPNDAKTMYAACLWSHWEASGDELYSFAIITDDPPREVLETGHDRCVIQIREDRIMEWLDCAEKTDAELMDVLTDKPAVRYERRLIDQRAQSTLL